LPNGDCVEAKDGTLGFDLGAAANRAAPPTNPAPAARPQNSVASLGRPNPAPGAALPPPTLDLLLTFDTDSANLTDQGVANAKVFAEALKRPELKQARFEIEGHTDASGTREYNLALSEKRAEAVKAFLVSQGVEADRLQTVGYASDHLALPDQPLSRANRRVVARRMQ
jgi:outer membrane protein OmpA-like peptidoglycan-associated protein